MSRRGIAFAAAAAVASVLLVAQVLGSTGAPSGPAGSSYSTSLDGYAAWGELLRANGVPVTPLRASIGSGDAAPGSTIVLVDPALVTDGDARQIAAAVRGGAHLIAGGDLGPLTAALSLPETRPAPALRVALPLAPVPEVAGVRRVELGAVDAAADSGDLLPILGSGTSIVASTGARGSGTVVLLEDASVLSNRYLDRASNARLGLSLVAGDGPVLFLEGPHGYGPATGLSALPRRAWVVLVLLAAAALVFGLARARRLGPPDPEEPPLAPPRVEFLDAVAATLSDRATDVELAAALREGLAEDLTAAGPRRSTASPSPADRPRTDAGGDEASLVAAGRTAAHEYRTITRTADRNEGAPC